MWDPLAVFPALLDQARLFVVPFEIDKVDLRVQPLAPRTSVSQYQYILRTIPYLNMVFGIADALALMIIENRLVILGSASLPSDVRLLSTSGPWSPVVVDYIPKQSHRYCFHPS